MTLRATISVKGSSELPAGGIGRQAASNAAAMASRQPIRRKSNLDPSEPGRLGQEIPPREQQTPKALGAYHKAEIERLWPIIKAAGIKGRVKNIAI
jgi:hypothetical protein